MKPPSCRDIKREVPRAKMQEGISKCKENIVDYLQDTLLIANTGRLYHALISLEFALEEFGKILLIQETIAKDKSDPVKINGANFCNHPLKSNKALNFLDRQQKFRILFETGWKREGFWQAGDWGETVINERTRLECCFVDFINNDWTLGRQIKKEYLEDMVTIINEGLKRV